MVSMFQFRYHRLEKKGNIPSDEELDKELAKYFDDSLPYEPTNIDIDYYTNILEHSQNYLKELNLAEKLLE